MKWQADAIVDIVGCLLAIHVGFEIVGDVLENQIKTTGRGLNDVKQFDLH